MSAKMVEQLRLHDVRTIRNAADVIDQARAHLGAAISQSVPSDDQIIMDHVRKAYDLLSE